MTVISASIMPLAALFFTPLPARSSLCALEALRWVVGGANMTTPGGAGTTTRCSYDFLRARRTGFHHGVGAPTGPPLGAPILRIAPSRCPKPSLALTPAAVGL